MVGVLRIDQEVAIHPVTLDGSEGEAQLDVRKDKVDAREPAIAKLRVADALIGVEQIVVGDAQRANGRRGRLDLGKVLFKAVRAHELIVEHRAGGMNMRLPSKPPRA
ncbi:MAG: hypothetical protein ACAH27_09590 [Xanthobacteraceae bacterium]